MTGGAAGQAGGPFTADEDRALDALALAWGGTYDEFWVHDGKWGARRKGAGDDVVTAASPDELDRAIREREVTP